MRDEPLSLQFVIGGSGAGGSITLSPLESSSTLYSAIWAAFSTITASLGSEEIAFFGRENEELDVKFVVYLMSVWPRITVLAAVCLMADEREPIFGDKAPWRSLSCFIENWLARRDFTEDSVVMHVDTGFFCLTEGAPPVRFIKTANENGLFLGTTDELVGVIPFLMGWFYLTV